MNVRPGHAASGRAQARVDGNDREVIPSLGQENQLKRQDLIRHLETHGCVLLREGAKHSVYYNSGAQRTSTVPRHREVKNPTAIRICKQLGVPDPLR